MAARQAAFLVRTMFVRTSSWPAGKCLSGTHDKAHESWYNPTHESRHISLGLRGAFVKRHVHSEMKGSCTFSDG